MAAGRRPEGRDVSAAGTEAGNPKLLDERFEMLDQRIGPSIARERSPAACAPRSAPRRMLGAMSSPLRMPPEAITIASGQACRTSTIAWQSVCPSREMPKPPRAVWGDVAHSLRLAPNWCRPPGHVEDLHARIPKSALPLRLKGLRHFLGDQRHRQLARDRLDGGEHALPIPFAAFLHGFLERIEVYDQRIRLYGRNRLRAHT